LPGLSNGKITALVTIHASDFAVGVADSAGELEGSVIPEAAPSRLCAVRSGLMLPDGWPLGARLADVLKSTPRRLVLIAAWHPRVR
jgi:hypothetical protein